MNTTDKIPRWFDVSCAAHEVRDHDINVDDEYAVEAFLRRQNPKVGKRFIAEVIAAAQEQRDEDYVTALFERIEKQVEAWPAKVSDDFIAWVTDDVEDIIGIRGLSGEGGSEWRPAAARCAALLLIEQVARRKYNAESEKALDEFAAEESAP